MSEPSAIPLETWGSPAGGDLRCHATAVALAGRGVLLLGGAGAGKSGLALALMAHGADLLADDAVVVRATPEGLHLHRPRDAPALIEARGVGLLQAPGAVLAARLCLAVDLERSAGVRLPPRHRVAWRGHHVDLILGAGVPNLWAAVILYLRGGRTH